MSTTNANEAACRIARRSPADFAIIASGGRWEPAPHLELLNDQLMRIADGEINRLMVYLPPRHGKALALDTPIPTPTGWTTIGNLTVGDEVFAETGEICCVVAKSEVYKSRPVYKVKTDSGDEILADAEHEWLVRLCRKHKRYLPKTTEYLANRTCDRRPQIKPIGPLSLPEKDDLPIDPYVLGVWLGDGRTDSSAICSADQEIIDKVATIEGDINYYEKRNGTQHFRIGPHYRNGATQQETLQGRLRTLGVLSNKHIPLQYLRASCHQRKRLLQGLIDTDGYVASDGQVEYCSISQRLAEDVKELINTLGVKASIITGKAICNGKDCGTKFRVMFYMKDAASITRKASKTKDGTHSPGTYLSFEPAGYADTVCIQVDSPSHLFLCGKTMVPTHNSELVSKYTPAWYLGMFPDRRIILTSYEADFAAQWGRRARDLLEEFGMVFPEPVRVKSDSSAANRWDIEGHTGGMITAGAGGAITGKGGQLIIIDDAIKNAEQAASQTYRDKTWEWYKSTLYTRLEPNGAIIHIQTRWHEDDLGGRLLAEMQAGGDVWTVINLPAIAEEHDQLGRAVGEPLWPARFPYESLMQIKRTVGSYWWSSLYQQRPAPEEGEIFRRKWWQFYTGPPKIKEYIQSWDCSFKDEKGSDYVCGQVWGRNGADVYLMDWVHDRLDLPATMQAIKTLSHKWQLARRKLIEDKANGPAVIQMLQRKVPGLVPVEPHGGKIVRARAVTPYIESGNVYLPDPSINPRIHDFIEECSAFPKGQYDDQVDAMTQALLFFIERGGETIQRADPGHTSQVPNIGYTHDSIPSMVG